MSEMLIRTAPYRHQQNAFTFVQRLFDPIKGSGAALLMEMGTGKTLTSIAITGTLWNTGCIRRLLIVAPLSILGVWEDEFQKFAKMLEKYEREQTELMAKLDELRPMLERAEEETQSVDRFMRLVRAYTEIEALTADVGNEFIERIEVGETEVVEPRRFSHWKDEKRQNIRIVYNYIGAVPQEGKAAETTTREKTITAT